MPDAAGRKRKGAEAGADAPVGADAGATVPMPAVPVGPDVPDGPDSPDSPDSPSGGQPTAATAAAGAAAYPPAPADAAASPAVAQAYAAQPAQPAYAAQPAQPAYPAQAAQPAYAAQAAQPPQQGWAQPRWQPPTYGEWEDRHGRATPSGALRRAFSGVPAREYLLDVVAALLLLVSLLLPWDFGHAGRDRLEVVALTALSLVSLAIPYLARSGAFADRLDAGRAARLRFLANVPYLVMVAAFLLVDVLQGDWDEFGDGTVEGGVGAALALGLAGAVLAMRPREEELGAWRALDRRWVVVPAALAGVAALWALGSVIEYLVDAGDSVSGAVLVASLLLVLVSPTVLVLLAVGMLRGDEGWRLAAGAVAAAPIALAVGGSVAMDGTLLESVHLLGSGLVLWPAVAAAAWAPSARRAMRVTGERWADAARRVLTLAVVIAAVAMIAAALLISEPAVEDDGPRWVVLTILALLYAGVAVAGVLLLRGPRREWVPLGLVVAGVLLVLGVLGVLVASGTVSGASRLDVLLALPIPVAVAGFVLAHASHVARGVGPHPALADAPRPAPVGPPAPPAPPASEAVRLATDPATPQATLADLATRVPETRVHIARHPAAYPALLDWLAALGDPEVSRAVAERRASGG